MEDQEQVEPEPLPRRVPRPIVESRPAAELPPMEKTMAALRRANRTIE